MESVFVLKCTLNIEQNVSELDLSSDNFL